MESDTLPSQHDQEIINDFIEESEDAFCEIESLLIDLEKNGFEHYQLSELMRRLHSMSFVLRLGGYDKTADLGERIVAILDKIIGEKLPFSELIVDVILVSVENLQSLTEKLFHKQTVDEVQFERKIQALDNLLICQPEDVGDVAVDILNEYSGKNLLYDAAGTVQSDDQQTRRPEFNAPSNLEIGLHFRNSLQETKLQQDQALTDLALFYDMMQRLEKSRPGLMGRGRILLRIVQAMNLEAGLEVDPLQMEAAVYMHDFGMVFVAGDRLDKPARLVAAENKALHEHPFVAAELMQRLGGWDEAVRIVMQHHERQDGSGYPERISGDGICGGAQMLAIADTVYAITHKQAYRNTSRPVLHAVAEINSCADTQFSRHWVDVFNKVIRKTGGSLLFDQ
jgi:chemotaxis protein histidine kinase CheA